jgi:glycogen synthase
MWLHGRRCHFIEPHPAERFFGRDRLYGHSDDVERFTAFSKAAFELMVKTTKRPDVIHCHDWQTGLVPDFVTTASPNHAAEALYGDGALGLDATPQVHEHKFRGILNGVDYEVWNPEVDSVIPARYSADELHGKFENKERLLERFWLRKAWSPIVAFVGRLDEHKGMQLVHHGLFYALSKGAQFVLLGEPVDDDGISSHLRHLKRDLNDNPDCHLEISYTEELAHLVYAGTDMLVCPACSSRVGSRRWSGCGLRYVRRSAGG